MMKENEKYTKEKKKTFIDINLALFVIACVFTMSLSVGYSLLNSELNISGEAKFKVRKDIKITNLELYETTNYALESYDSSFDLSSTNIGVTLPQLNSTITYKLTITNNSSVAKIIGTIDEVLKSNNDIVYEIPNSQIDEIMQIGDIKQLYIIFRYKEGLEQVPENKTLNTKLSFNFITPDNYLAQDNGTDSNGTFLGGNIARKDVETIEFLPSLEVSQNAISSWDASFYKDNGVIAWYTDNDSNGLYELYIGGNGEVIFPRNASALFKDFVNLTSINFNNIVNARYSTNMQELFMNDSKIKIINLNNFDTTSVNNVSRMFYECASIESIDITGMNFNKIINSDEMFDRIPNQNFSLYVEDEQAKKFIIDNVRTDLTNIIVSNSN